MTARVRASLPDGATWKRIDLALTPGPRNGHAMVWDEARSEMLLYGGLGALAYAAETWVLRGPTSP